MEKKKTTEVEYDLSYYLVAPQELDLQPANGIG